MSKNKVASVENTTEYSLDKETLENMSLVKMNENDYNKLLNPSIIQ